MLDEETPRLEDIKNRIEELYKEKNYHNIKITYAVKPSANNQADIEFDIDEGEKVRIRDIALEYLQGRTLDKIIKEEVPDGDFTVDEKQKQVYLTEEGMSKVEQLMVKEGLLQEDDSLYNANNLALVHHLNAGLRAHHLYQKDVDYIVQNSEIVGGLEAGETIGLRSTTTGRSFGRPNGGPLFGGNDDA